MSEKFNLSTEGVLIIASSNALKKKYNTQEFDYNFPEGLDELIKQNLLVAITHSGGDYLIAECIYSKDLDYLEFDKVIEQSIKLSEDDELLVLSHAEFTMICDKDGDYKNFGSPVTYVKSNLNGMIKIQIGVIDTTEEFDKYQAYFRIKINIKEDSDELLENYICELCE